MLSQQNMIEERKWLWGLALWQRQSLTKEWQMQPGLMGKKVRL